MLDSDRNRGRTAGVLCALAVCCILIAGLWPLGHPRNDVTWILDQHAVRFGRHGTILSTRSVSGSKTTGMCTLEMWLRPRLSEASSTVLAFYDTNSVGLSLHQSLTDLRLDSEANGKSPVKIYVGSVFRAAKLVFLTLVSGPGGTEVFLDGVSAKRLPDESFPSSPDACSETFVVGDSPRDNDTWEGELSGLAIYLHAFTPQQVRTSYQSWAKSGRPDESIDWKPAALYLFDEKEGYLIHDHGSSGMNLYIPERYVIAHQVMLESPLRAFEPTWDYVQDVAINIGGFIPFGFTLSAFLLKTRGVSRVTALVVLAGFLLSLIIESLQAYLPTRNSDLTDVMTNTLGTWMGAMLHREWLPPRLRVFSWMRTSPA
jgi:VanZ family protein